MKNKASISIYFSIPVLTTSLLASALKEVLDNRWFAVFISITIELLILGVYSLIFNESKKFKALIIITISFLCLCCCFFILFEVFIASIFLICIALNLFGLCHLIIKTRK